MRARMARFLRLLWYWLPVILWATMILSAANDRFSAAETAGWLDRLFGGAPWIVNVTIRKLGHVFVYAVQGLLAWRARRSVTGAMTIVAAVAIADETMQAATITRQGSPFDVFLDICGAFLALACIPAVRAQLAKPEGKRQKAE